MAKNAIVLHEHAFAHDDPLAVEHGEIIEWVNAAISTLNEHRYYEEVNLKSVPAGEKILNGDASQSLRYISAALAQVRHWDKLAEQIRKTAENEMDRIDARHLPQWTEVWCRRRQTATVINSLMRRKLPFSEEQLLALVTWCSSDVGNSSISHFPVSYIVRGLERFAENNSIQASLLQALPTFSRLLRSSNDKQVSKLGTSVEQLSSCAEEDVNLEQKASKRSLPPPTPALAGHPGILTELKQRLGMLPSQSHPVRASATGPDEFPLAEDSPVSQEHILIGKLYEEVASSDNYYRVQIEEHATGRQILRADPESLGRIVLAAAERHVHALLSSLNLADTDNWRVRYSVGGTVEPLLGVKMSLDHEGRFDLLLYLATQPGINAVLFDSLVNQLIEQTDQVSQALSMGERYVLSLVRTSVIAGPLLGKSSPPVSRLTTLIADGAVFCLEPGEYWADAINADFAAVSVNRRKQYAALFAHLLTATSSRPSKKWLNRAGELIKSADGKKLRARILEWLPLVSKGRSISLLGRYVGDARGAADTINDENATILRGLLWTIPILGKADELAREVAAVALSAYKKVPGVGPRAVKVGNAAIYALSQLSPDAAVAQLAMLKIRVKFGTAQKEIEKAYTVAAESLGLAREEIEEMGIPSYGLEGDGRLEETFGNYRAELSVTGASAHLKWFDASGKSLKSVPAKVRTEHKQELKELRQSVKDIQGMLPAQRDRIDSMFLLQKSWPIEQWRERYLDHPLMATIACRLLWCIDQTPVFFVDGDPIDIDGDRIEYGKTAEVTLWHPVGRSVDEVIACRQRLENLTITQPFKQAHREVYLLTDAERNTRTYSNRFAAHVIRQHQFNALCAARGWKNRLRLMVDDTYLPPCKELSNWGLRAEFWVEGIGEDYGTDTNESGVFVRLATDQVRFYRIGAANNSVHASGGGYSTDAAGPGHDNINEPLPLDQIPPLVFSEVMRDVDLFVGVASVGNDPTWQDGGPEGRYRDYWHSYSFGELTGTASTRKEVLERLIPRLKISDLCSFSDRFLVVEGKIRTYKIHLGSGNILMEPNDQYLCIVPDRRATGKQDDLFLPFEGDNMLSVILSKALMLAADHKIKDSTIVNQITRE